MLFIGQIVIEPAIFGVPEGRVAYIFIDPEPGVDSWDPQSGRNAVVIQQARPDRIPVVTHDGPTLTETNFQDGKPFKRDLELGVTLKFYDRSPDPPRIGNRFQIGGEPAWVQHGEGAPDGWTLLLQLDDYLLDESQHGIQPSYNFGTGAGFVLMDPTRNKAVLMWEC